VLLAGSGAIKKKKKLGRFPSVKNKEADKRACYPKRWRKKRAKTTRRKENRFFCARGGSANERGGCEKGIGTKEKG